MEDLRELYRHRELLYTIAGRDIKVRYKQSVMGFLWAILMPTLIVLAGVIVRYGYAFASGKRLETSDIAGVAVKSVPWAFLVSSIRFSRNIEISKMNELIIEAGRTERNYWHDVWRYRELFYFLAWRDFLVRYKQTVVGAVWSVVRPVLTMIVLTVVFGKFGKMPSGGVTFTQSLSFVACCPGNFSPNALSESGNSLVSNSNLISKVYFPRLIVPASSVITCFVDFVISGLLLILMMVWYQVTLRRTFCCCQSLRWSLLGRLLERVCGFLP